MSPATSVPGLPLGLLGGELRHGNPRILAAARAQLDRGHPDQPGLPPRPVRAVLRRGIAELVGKQMVLRLMTPAPRPSRPASRWPASGATASRGVPAGMANIVVATTTSTARNHHPCISFSDDRTRAPTSGPYTPGFRQCPSAIRRPRCAAAVDDTTRLAGAAGARAGQLTDGPGRWDPCQAPRPGYLGAFVRSRRLCTHERSERAVSSPTRWQAGLARTGRTLGVSFRRCAGT